jgi:hypothetical protein
MFLSVSARVIRLRLTLRPSSASLFSFGGPHKYGIQCMISLSFCDCRTGLLWYVVRVSTLLCLRVFCVW